MQHGAIDVATDGRGRARHRHPRGCVDRSRAASGSYSASGSESLLGERAASASADGRICPAPHELFDEQRHTVAALGQRGACLGREVVGREGVDSAVALLCGEGLELEVATSTSNGGPA